jgi:hypothetical protein
VQKQRYSEGKKKEGPSSARRFFIFFLPFSLDKAHKFEFTSRPMRKFPRDPRGKGSCGVSKNLVIHLLPYFPLSLPCLLPPQHVPLVRCPEARCKFSFVVYVLHQVPLISGRNYFKNFPNEYHVMALPESSRCHSFILYEFIFTIKNFFLRSYLKNLDNSNYIYVYMICVSLYVDISQNESDICVIYLARSE